MPAWQHKPCLLTNSRAGIERIRIRMPAGCPNRPHTTECAVGISSHLQNENIVIRHLKATLPRLVGRVAVVRKKQNHYSRRCCSCFSLGGVVVAPVLTEGWQGYLHIYACYGGSFCFFLSTASHYPPRDVSAGIRNLRDRLLAIDSGWSLSQELASKMSGTSCALAVSLQMLSRTLH